MTNRVLRLSAALLLAACAPHAGAAVVAQIPGPDGHWDYASFDRPHHRVLVGRSYGVMAVDVATRKISTVAPGSHVDGNLPLPDGRILFSNEDKNTVAIANGTTNQIEKTIPVGNEPDAAVWDSASGKAFVMNHASGEISVIDPESGTEQRRIPVGGTLEFAAVDGVGNLFVNVEDQAEIAVVDTNSLTVKARYKLAGCEEPSGLAYVTTGRVLISSCSNGHAKVIRATDGQELRDIPIGPHPDAVLYDQTRARAYIPTAGSLTESGEITVLSVSGEGRVTLAGHIATQRGARTIAEDPESGLLYLPTADYMIGPDVKPKPVDGTFRVLIVAPELDASN